MITLAHHENTVKTLIGAIQFLKHASALTLNFVTHNCIAHFLSAGDSKATVLPAFRLDVQCKAWTCNKLFQFDDFLEFLVFLNS